MDIFLTIITLGIFRFVFVNEGTAQIVTRFGKFQKPLYPGLRSFLYFWGFFGRLHKFEITDPIRNIKVRTIEVDTKEIVFDYPKERVISKDNVEFEVNAIVFFQVIDPYKAIFRVTDYPSALRNLVQAILRAEIGKHELEETYSNRTKISEELTREADKATDIWGIKVVRLEIKEFELGNFAEQLLRQKNQEIEKRQQILQAEGLREAQIKKGEGERDYMICVAQGNRAAAENDAEAVRIRAKADADAVKMKYDADMYGYNLISKLMVEKPEIKYFLQLHTADIVSDNLSKGPASKLFLPNDIDKLVGVFSVLSESLTELKKN